MSKSINSQANLAKIDSSSEVIQLLRRKKIEQLIGKSRSTIYRDIKRGLFTKPVNIGGDRVAWPSNEINEINKARIAGKSDNEIKVLVEKLEESRVA